MLFSRVLFGRSWTTLGRHWLLAWHPFISTAAVHDVITASLRLSAFRADRGRMNGFLHWYDCSSWIGRILDFVSEKISLVDDLEFDSCLTTICGVCRKELLGRTRTLTLISSWEGMCPLRPPFFFFSFFSQSLPVCENKWNWKLRWFVSFQNCPQSALTLYTDSVQEAVAGRFDEL